MPETDLSEPVSEWMRENGYTPHAEIQFGRRAIDLVGIADDGELVAVELKLCLSDVLIRQTAIAGRACHRAYAAFASSPREVGLDAIRRLNRAAGPAGNLGALQVGEDSVSVVIEARPYPPPPQIADVIRDRLRRCGEGGVAGAPRIVGQGRGVRAARAVDEFLAENPNASWREVFRSIDHHYASPLALRRAVEYQRRKRTRSRPLSD
jgi:hypothetical protein